MQRVLFVFSRESSFVAIDRAIIAERFELVERQERRPRLNPFAILRDVIRADLVFGWFAYWHTALPITFAWLLGRPSVLVIGGFDTANMPKVGYGLQQGGLRRALSRWTMKRARILVTNSFYSRREIEQNTGIPPERVAVVHHGIPDPFGSFPRGTRERMALTVGVVDQPNLERKGLMAFAKAALELPDVRFVIAGKWADDAIEQLRAVAAPNLELTGWVEDETLEQLYREAAVYVQASAHEGFGMSVAEAMLAGSIPVTSGAGALPEVVGDCGSTAAVEPHELAQAIRAQLDVTEQQRVRCRERVLSEFPIEMRREGILDAVNRALAGR